MIKILVGGFSVCADYIKKQFVECHGLDCDYNGYDEQSSFNTLTT